MACIITFPSFFKRKNQRSTKQSGGSYDTPSRYAKRHNGSENPYTNISAVERADGDTIPLQAVNVVALDRIRAKNDVEVHTQNRRFD